MDIIPIAILASDPITWEGSVALLSAHPDLLILPPELRPQPPPPIPRLRLNRLPFPPLSPVASIRLAKPISLHST